MPHFKNGREIKVGDKIVGKNAWSGVFAGTVIAIYVGAATCNINYIPTGVPTQSATASDCLHEEDAELSEREPTTAPG